MTDVLEDKAYVAQKSNGTCKLVNISRVYKDVEEDIVCNVDDIDDNKVNAC